MNIIRIIKHPKQYWEYLWENTIGPLWRLKWGFWDAIHRRQTRRLKITTLDRQWWDRDEVLLHAAFQILVNYWEKENPKEHHFFEPEDEVLESLYIWWTKERPKRIDPFDRQYLEGIARPTIEEMWKPCGGGCAKFVCGEEKYGEYWTILRKAEEIVQMYNKEDQDKLIRLCQNFRFMWT